MIRVVLADDQAVVRGGLRMILESEDDIEVSGEAGDGRHALDLVRELDPDIVLMDIRMPTLDGIAATRRLVSSGSRTRVLVLTTYGLDENVYDALKAGAAGFLVKTDSPAQLVHAVRVVASGEALLAPDVTRRLIDRFVTGLRPSTPHQPSSKRSRHASARSSGSSQAACPMLRSRQHCLSARAPSKPTSRASSPSSTSATASKSSSTPTNAESSNQRVADAATSAGTRIPRRGGAAARAGGSVTVVLGVPQEVTLLSASAGTASAPPAADSRPA
jgi:DNA-binding NarL/FixJ family response regulator